MIKLLLTPDEASAVVSQLPPEARRENAGLFYDGEYLHLPEAYADAAGAADRTRIVLPIPSQVSALQMRRAIRLSGLKQRFDQQIAVADEEVVEAWDFGSVVHRRSEIFSPFIEALAGSADAADDLFRLAAQQAER